MMTPEEVYHYDTGEYDNEEISDEDYQFRRLCYIDESPFDYETIEDWQ